MKEAALIETEEVLSNLRCSRLVIVVSAKHQTSSDAKMNDAFVLQEVKEIQSYVWPFFVNGVQIKD